LRQEVPPIDKADIAQVIVQCNMNIALRQNLTMTQPCGG
jgi:hypothetical protein